MNFMSNLLSISTLELQRVFSTRRGLLVLLAFALIWLLILRYPIYGAANWLSEGGNSRLLGSMFNTSMTRALLNWPVAEFAVLWVLALYLFPIFTLVLAADQTASDRARGTLRLLSLHTTRSSIFLGRFCGLLLVQTLLLLLVLCATFALAIARDGSQVEAAVQAAAVVFVNVWLLLAAYTAAMALISLFAGSARQATTWAVILWIVLTALIAWLGSRFPEAAALRWTLPGAHISRLLGYNDWQSLQLSIIPLAQTIVLLTIGYICMRRRDL